MKASNKSMDWPLGERHTRFDANAGVVLPIKKGVGMAGWVEY